MSDMFRSQREDPKRLSFILTIEYTILKFNSNEKYKTIQNHVI